jgi:hypothetical protein
MPPKVESEFILNLAESFAKGNHTAKNWIDFIQKSGTRSTEKYSLA